MRPNTKNATNYHYAIRRSGLVIKGTAHFSRRAYAAICIEEGKLFHVESFFGNDGRVARSQANAYLACFVAGQSLGLHSVAHPINRLTTTFDTRDNREAIAAHLAEIQAADIAAGTPLETFFQAYVAAALWSSQDDDGNPLDDNYDDSDIAPETLDAMRRDCVRFYEFARADIHCNGAPESSDTPGGTDHKQAAMAGHDFWLTRNGHGAGFWDGDWPDGPGGRLDNLSKAFRGVDLYIGDDGAIYA